MISFIKQVFIVLLHFSKSLATKYVSLNNEHSLLIYSLLIYINAVEVVII